MVYFDTSILAPCYYPEPLSELAERKLLACKQPAIGQLTLLEINVYIISQNKRKKPNKRR